MKVTFLLRYDAGLYYGGAEVQAQYTAEGLRKLGVDVEVFSSLTTDVGDVMHCFGCLRLFNDVAQYCRHRGIPYLVSTIFYVGLTRLGLAWRRLRATTHRDSRLRRRLLNGASLLLPNSMAEAELVATLFRQPMAKMHVVPNGVEERFAEGDPDLFRNRFGLREPFVLNVARLEPRKNQLRLIEALAGTGLKLVILGQEADARYAVACRRAAGSDVLFLPPVPHDDPLLAGAYAACRVFALPSLVETPGIAALEAAAAGARVVTTPVGGGREYFGEHARYVLPSSAAGIRSAVLSAWEDDRPTDAQREHVLSRYSWAQVARRTLEGYERVLAGKPVALGEYGRIRPTPRCQ